MKYLLIAIFNLIFLITNAQVITKEFEEFRKNQNLEFKDFKDKRDQEFSNLLKNPIYYGGVPIKAYKDDKACIADGIHEPLISKALFDKDQDILNNRRKKQ